MNQREVSEIRRRFRADRSNITTVYGCYVSDTGEVLARFSQSVGMMLDDEKEKVLGVLKRALSGTLGKNLLDLSIPTKEVAEGENHALLRRLRESKLADEEAREALCEKIIKTTAMETNYLILMACNAYDVPSRTRDGTAFVMLGSANSSEPSEIRAALESGANGGNGLVRTESMILNDYDEERQVAEYRKMLECANGWPVVVRLYDPGADDCAPWVQTVQTLAARDSLYKTQTRALLRAGSSGALRVMVPMICGVQGWDDWLNNFEECKKELRREGIPFEEELPVGCMIEVPASAL